MKAAPAATGHAPHAWRVQKDWIVPREEVDGKNEQMPQTEAQDCLEFLGRMFYPSSTLGPSRPFGPWSFDLRIFEGKAGGFSPCAWETSGGIRLAPSGTAGAMVPFRIGRVNPRRGAGWRGAGPTIMWKRIRKDRRARPWVEPRTQLRGWRFASGLAHGVGAEASCLPRRDEVSSPRLDPESPG